MEIRYFYGCTPQRTRVVFEVSLDLLAKTPEWSATAPNPPLAVRDAIRVGRDALLRFIEHEREWVLESVQLRYAEENDRWFYLMDYQLLRDKDGNDITIMGRPFNLSIPVLMDGKSPDESSDERLAWLRSKGWF